MKNSTSRTSKVVKSTVYGAGGYIVTYLFSFLTRTVFIFTLGEVYLGLQGLFSSILSLLALTELGLGSAIMFSMYKPIADNDTKKIRALMAFYKKAYWMIGIIISILGLLLLPFLSFFVNESPDIPESLELIYLLYLLNTVLSYFLVYKQSIIRAYQQTHIVSLYSNAFNIIRDIFQIIILLYFQSFIPTLIIMIVFTVSMNYALYNKANKMFPFIKNVKKEELNKAEKEDITTKIKAMFLYRVGAFVVHSTDNILISKFFGVVTVGIYSNYFLILTLVKTITGFLTTAITPSIGNVISTSDIKKVREIFEELNFLTFWLYSLCSVFLFILFNPFISLWLQDEKYLLSTGIVTLIVVNFYLYGIHQNMLIFRNALGLYVQAKWKPVFEAIINLIASLILIHYFGLIGVFLGTTISFVTTALWIEPYVLYKYYLGKGLSSYFFDYTHYALVTLVSIFSISYISDLIRLDGFYMFIVNIFLVLIIHNVIVILIYHRKSGFKYTIIRFKKVLFSK